jgi:hypothetical protein
MPVMELIRLRRWILSKAWMSWELYCIGFPFAPNIRGTAVEDKEFLFSKKKLKQKKF